MSGDRAWVHHLARFLAGHSGVEAVLIDNEEKKVSVATLGPVDEAVLKRHLDETLRQIEGDSATQETWAAVPSRVNVRRLPGETLLEKPTCPTAPLFWRWREFPWPQPSTSPEARQEEEKVEWQALAGLAGACGVFGIAGVVIEQVGWLEPWGGIPFYVIAMLAGGWDAAKDVSREIPKGHLDIHFLMLAVAIGAAAIGAWARAA